MTCSNLICPYLTSPYWSVVTWLDMFWLDLTCCDLTWPVPTWLAISDINLICPDLSYPVLTCLNLYRHDLTCHDMTFPNLTWAVLTCLDLQTWLNLSWHDFSRPDLAVLTCLDLNCPELTSQMQGAHKSYLTQYTKYLTLIWLLLGTIADHYLTRKSDFYIQVLGRSPLQHFQKCLICYLPSSTPSWCSEQ